LGNFVFIFKVVKLNVCHAFLNLRPWVFFISIVKIEDFVEFDAMTLQFFDVLLGLRESNENETSNERKSTCLFIYLEDKLINAEIFEGQMLFF